MKNLKVNIISAETRAHFLDTKLLTFFPNDKTFSGFCESKCFIIYFLIQERDIAKLKEKEYLVFGKLKLKLTQGSCFLTAWRRFWVTERTDWTGDEPAWTAACKPAAPHMLLLSAPLYPTRCGRSAVGNHAGWQTGKVIFVRNPFS